MANPELLSHIKTQIKNGMSRDDITAQLLQVGWKIEDINEAFDDSGSIDVNAGVVGLPGPMGLFAESIEIFRVRWLSLIGAVVLGLVITMPFSGLAFGAVLGSFFLAMITPYSLILMIPLTILLIIFANVINTWGYIAQIYIVKGYRERLGIISAFKVSFSKIFPFFLVVMMSGLFIATGLIMFVIVGIIFAVWVIFAMFVVIEDDVRGISALIKSREYVRGYSWDVFLRLITIPGLYLIFSFILQAIIDFSEGSGNIVVSIILIVMTIGFVVISPLLLIYLYVLFIHLKRVRGAFTFQPTRKTKMIYLLPVLSIPALLVLLLGLSFSVIRSLPPSVFEGWGSKSVEAPEMKPSPILSPQPIIPVETVDWEPNTHLNNTNKVSSYSSPTMGDLDGDGDLDMLVGETDGKSIAFEWIAGEWLPKPAWDTPDIGTYTSPALVDLDNDGDLDLMIGEAEGTVAYKNTGTIQSPQWVAEPNWSRIRAGLNTNPVLADVDGDDDSDLFIGTDDGTIYAYENVGSKNVPVWEEKSQWLIQTQSSYVHPGFIDFDDDGDFDILVSLGGKVSMGFENQLNTNNKWLERNDWTLPTVGEYSAPYFVTASSTLNIDLVIGDDSGTVAVFTKRKTN